MEIFIFVTLFLLGLIIGSFLNVVIYRIKEKKALDGRSFCPSCKEQLRWYDLVPVLSWVLLRARCRNCGQPISAQYPLVELSTAFIFGLMGLNFISFELMALFNLFFWLFFAACLIIIFVYDVKHMIIPDEVIYPALIGSLLLAIINGYFSGWQTVIGYLAAGLIAGGFFYLLAEVSDGKWMGGGDIKLAALMGFLLGWPGTLVAMYVGFITGAIFGLVLLGLKKKNYTSRIPFGPFLVAGTFISILFSEQILSFYVKIFS